MESILLTNQDIDGKYAAFDNQDNRNVVCVGDSYAFVFNEAVKKGFSSPIIVYIPENDIVNIY